MFWVWVYVFEYYVYFLVLDRSRILGFENKELMLGFLFSFDRCVILVY